MVLGFIVFWPIGLAILAWKLWQKKAGYEGDIVAFTKEKWDAIASGNWASGNWASGNGASCSWPYGSHHWGSAPRDRYGARGRSGSTGNLAFDEWRSAELDRLEEEYRKLVAAEREFAEFMETLRRARDREEFDRFMNERRDRQGS